MKQKILCGSTHGGAGYSYGDTIIIYRSKDNPEVNIRGEFKCGGCGAAGPANPTGGRTHCYTIKENFWKWLKNEEKFTEPSWPEWITKIYKYI